MKTSKKISVTVFYANQCSINENNSVFLSPTNHITDQYLANIEFMKDDIKKIICKLDHNKAQGHNRISIRMLKMSGDTIIERLFRIFKTCLKCGIFPDGWKKGNRLYRFLKKATNKASKTIIQSLFFHFLFSPASKTVWIWTW